MLVRLLQEAQDIFGVDFDFDEFKDYDGEESEEEEDDEVCVEYCFHVPKVNDQERNCFKVC